MSFLEKLADEKIIKKSDIPALEAELSKGKKDIDDVLTDFGIDEKTILEQKSSYLKIPARILSEPRKTSLEVLKYIPEESARYYKFVPIGIEKGVLEVGILDPDNIEARDALQFISTKIGLPYKIFLISKSDFLSVLESYKGLTGEIAQALGGLDVSSADIDFKKVEDYGEDISVKEKIIEDAPVTKIVAVIIRHATEGNASDIHIENVGDRIKVRFRVDGILHTSLFLPVEIHNAILARIKILSNLKLDEKRKPQDGRFSARLDGRKIDIRVSTFPTYYGEKVVMRILDPDRGVRSLESLGLNKKSVEIVREAIRRPYGLILLSGPTGSGKTTTLYSMLNELDREQKNVVSLEDPIEYNITSMNQSQIVPEIGYNFATGLRSVLRQDPDIIMVGEIRDRETAQLAIQSALTGHLVFSTIHTNNAIGVISRLVNMGVDPYLIAPTLIMSMAQRLVRLICPSSKKPIPIEGSYKAMVEKQFSDLPIEFRDPINEEIKKSGNFYDVEPSADCPSGTRGRIGVFEIMLMDKDVEALILKNATEAEISKLMRTKGMLTLKEDAMLKCLQGKVPFYEVNSL